MERDKSEEVTVPNRKDSGDRQDFLFLSNLPSMCFGCVGWQEGTGVLSHGISPSGSWREAWEEQVMRFSLRTFRAALS